MCLQLEAAQTARIEELKKNLLRYVDDLYSDQKDMFHEHLVNMAEQKLATAHYGPVMLMQLGKVYCLQAKRARGNLGAYFKCAAALSLDGECTDVARR